MPSFLVMVIFAPGSSSLLAMSTLLTVSCARLMTVRPSSVRAKLSPEMALPLASVVTKYPSSLTSKVMETGANPSMFSVRVYLPAASAFSSLNSLAVVLDFHVLE